MKKLHCKKLQTYNGKNSRGVMAGVCMYAAVAAWMHNLNQLALIKLKYFKHYFFLKRLSTACCSSKCCLLHMAGMQHAACMGPEAAPLYVVAVVV